MKNNWNLDNLYIDFNSEQFKKDIFSIKNSLNDMKFLFNSNLFFNSNPIEFIEKYIVQYNQLGTTISKLGEFCQLMLSTDSSNIIAMNNLEKIEDFTTDLTEYETNFSNYIGKISIENLEVAINGSEIIKEHEFFIIEIKEQSKYLLSPEQEITIAKFQTTASLSWMKLWENITSTVSVDIDGEKQPLPAVRNMAYSPNKEIRKKAYEKELMALEEISQTAAFCLNSIKGEVITSCKLRGYDSPLEMTLLNSRMKKEVLDAMINEMKEFQPLLRKYLHKKAEILGHKNGLPFYDLFAPLGETTMEFTYEEAKDFIIKNFNSFSKELGDYAKKAFDENWIDVYPKEGKRGGAFCANLHSIKESRILMNFSGSFNDVLTLAHELGHGYHGHCLNEQSHINSDYPMPIAETASTFCETLVKNSALKDASEKDKITILESDISDNLQIIMDILSRFLFEDAVFEKRKEGSISVDELCELMLKAQEETYGNGLDPNYKHKYMWVVKPHYYDVDFNYYNFPYAFGLLFAKGLYGIYEKEGAKFATDYKNILASTGNKNHIDIALMANIDITNKEFWKSSLSIIKKDIEEFLKLS